MTEFSIYQINTDRDNNRVGEPPNTPCKKHHTFQEKG